MIWYIFNKYYLKIFLCQIVAICHLHSVALQVLSSLSQPDRVNKIPCVNVQTWPIPYRHKVLKFCECLFCNLMHLSLSTYISRICKNCRKPTVECLSVALILDGKIGFQLLCTNPLYIVWSSFINKFTYSVF